jgi:hypothetical protein
MTATTTDCQCPKCGRLHRRLSAGVPPASISGRLSHADLCFLSRVFVTCNDVRLDSQQGGRINEWLKTQIETANGNPDVTGHP